MMLAIRDSNCNTSQDHWRCQSKRRVMDKKYQGISYFFSCIELLAKMEDKRIKMSKQDDYTVLPVSTKYLFPWVERTIFSWELSINFRPSTSTENLWTTFKCLDFVWNICANCITIWNTMSWLVRSEIVSRSTPITYFQFRTVFTGDRNWTWDRN